MLCRSLQKPSRFQNSLIEDLLQKANVKLKTQVPKTKNCKTNVTPTAPFYPSLPDFSCSTNPLSELPFYSEEMIKQLPFKIRPPKAAGNPLQASFTPWSKIKLRAIVKGFLKPREDSQKFSEELRILFGANDLGLSDLYQLVHILVGPGEAPNQMQKAEW